MNYVLPLDRGGLISRQSPNPKEKKEAAMAVFIKEVFTNKI